jgi:hypothetical protein
VSLSLSFSCSLFLSCSLSLSLARSLSRSLALSLSLSCQRKLPLRKGPQTRQELQIQATQRAARPPILLAQRVETNIIIITILVETRIIGIYICAVQVFFVSKTGHCGSSIDMYTNHVGHIFMKYVKMHSNEFNPLFYFIREAYQYSPRYRISFHTHLIY